MSNLTVGTAAAVSRAQTAGAVAGPSWARGLPWGLNLLFLAFTLFPPVSGNPRLSATFLAVGSLLLAWQTALRFRARRAGRALAVQLVAPQKSHYVQGTVQLCIYSYWATYWPPVAEAAPLIVAQLVYYYVLDALVRWTRGRTWQAGLGPLPIILSTNLFLWFRPDWFVFQFLMLTASALGKEFIRWNRDGRSTHVFNPSSFGLATASVVLIATNTTHLTSGLEVATTLGHPPHMYLLIFLLGLVVQYFFSVTLITLSAAASLVLLNVVYTALTGVYQFADTNIPIAVFLGLHLLVTDPATSPRTNVGRIVFGALYGVANFALYSVLLHIDQPEFYDKLLAVPLLNLGVPWIERLSRTGLLGSFGRWQERFRPRRLNLATMGCWAALFAWMLGSGFVAAPHPGASLAFWKDAFDQGKPDAGKKLFKMIGSAAEAGSGPAWTKLGEIYLEGKLTARNELAAERAFARASELGDLRGCADLLSQFLFLQSGPPSEPVERALARLEAECASGEEPTCCFLLGYAHETARARPRDLTRAFDLYRSAAARGHGEAGKALVRVALAQGRASEVPSDLARTMMTWVEGGDAQSCLYLAYLQQALSRGPQGVELAQGLLERACALGSAHACRVRGREDRWSLLPAAEPPPVPVPLPFADPARRAGGA